MTIEITHDSGEVDIIGRFHLDAAIHLVKDAIEDIGDHIEDEVKLQVPVDTGELKLHPIERSEIRLGRLTAIPSFGGGFTARGAGGRFIAGGLPAEEEIIVRQTITLPDHPKYAKWVHDGTGIYGPLKRPIIPHNPKGLFSWRNAEGKRVAARFTKGQKPNPYLDNAFVIINRTYVPLRIERLRLEIRSL